MVHWCTGSLVHWYTCWYTGSSSVVSGKGPGAPNYADTAWACASCFPRAFQELYWGRGSARWTRRYGNFNVHTLPSQPADHLKILRPPLQNVGHISRCAWTVFKSSKPFSSQPSSRAANAAINDERQDTATVSISWPASSAALVKGRSPATGENIMDFAIDYIMHCIMLGGFSQTTKWPRLHPAASRLLVLYTIIYNPQIKHWGWRIW